MQELVIIEKKPAVLVANFDQVKAALTQELERYNIVVTADTVVAAKKLATELNASKKVIKDAGRAAFDESVLPANEFMKKVGELIDQVEQSRQTLLTQVQKFEDQTREKVRALLIDYRNLLWEQHSVAVEFRKAEFSDLILLTSITKTDNLAKSPKDALESRVRDDKGAQDKTNMRLLLLENESYKAGLAAPLTRDHVQSFLFASDEDYQSQLQRILASEVNRQNAAEERLRQQIAKENVRAAEQAPAPQVVSAPAQVEVTKAPPQEPAPVAQAISQPLANGKVEVYVTANFRLEVNPKIDDSAIAAELRRVMEKAGITSLDSVSVSRSTAKAA